LHLASTFSFLPFITDSQQHQNLASIIINFFPPSKFQSFPSAKPPAIIVIIKEAAPSISESHYCHRQQQEEEANESSSTRPMRHLPRRIAGHIIDHCHFRRNATLLTSVDSIHVFHSL
ncbi:unnamed protein product, partial [Linum tenue]